MEYCIIKAIHKQHGQEHTHQIAIVVRSLRELQPDKPEDETQGFLAYNVPGKARMKMKTGRFLVRKLGLQTLLPDTAVQTLASKINAELFPGFGIRLDSGDDIRENYRDKVGGCSCMTGDCADYVGLYCDNPTRFSQLIIEQNGDSARAMVFHLDSGNTMLGRVYATCEYLKQRVRDYAEQQSWTTLGGTMSGLEYTDGEVPYMDNLQSYRIDGGLLTIGSCLDRAMGKLTSQCGSLDSGTSCLNCNEIVSEDCSYCDDYGNTYCEVCWDELLSCCNICGETVPKDDIEIVDEDQYWCENCIDNHAKQCESCNKFITDAVDVDGDSYCPSCAEAYPICNDCGEYTLETNNCGYCVDCKEYHVDEIPCGVETMLLFV